ncbi:DUF2948 family protein [Pontivivens nitratireducens]|uniref:DUF2948 family protein n=1 Tax=Pontivivens nitratireducens TaxID=2758038 RepID=A0A6G7VP46_9RHOB|nr:DUF2948 family protein [Pontibrevibacter nitratireducens]QIK41646.1 DUF2948 family protein [Pontibrevibacter nitratireducens]
MNGEDASFADGQESPLRLMAADADDLRVMSALCQDAVAQTAETSWNVSRREFALLLNRFRWEYHVGRPGQPAERVQSTLVINDVKRVRANGVDPKDRDLVLSLLELEFAPTQDGQGVLTLVLAGDGEIALDVESLNLTLTDVTRPYLAPSRKAPDHKL